MNINSARNKVEELLIYMKDLEVDAPKLYTSSKERLKEISGSCLEIVDLISRILGEEMLETDREEFGDKSDSSEVEHLCTTIDSTSSQLKELSGTEVIPSEARSAIIKEYKNGLQFMKNNTPSGIVELDECIDILHEWFFSRFIYNSNLEFKYNIRRIPNWIRDIVIVFCKYAESGHKDKFIDEFHSWMEQVKTNPDSTYAVPYSVYQFDRTHDPSMLTCCAAVMWDLLYHQGMYDLCLTSEAYSYLYLNSMQVYSMCGDLNPDCLDNYRDFKEDRSILLECNIHLQGGEKT